MIEKIVMFEHAVETLGYFSRELAATFEKIGYHTFFVDHKDTEHSMKHVKKFIKPGTTALLTFNFVGLSQEDYCMQADGRSIWESYGFPCYCIMVDHPLYYYKQLSRRIEHLVTFCVDREHVQYMHRFYPDIPCYFLPLAGNQRMRQIQIELPNYEDRTYDVAFIGNRMAFPPMEEQLKSRSKEYIDFYYEILNDLKHNPNQSVDRTMERYILREIPEATDAEIASAQHGMLFLELYIRAYYRDLVVRQLVDHGIRVYLFGKGWDSMPCEKPENMVCNGSMITSAECVQVIQNTKIALNVMPFFKDGAHDRIFTAMLGGAVAFTDDSIYLNEILTDGENCLYYKLDRLEEIPDRMNGILSQPDKAKQLVKAGHAYARQNHTWDDRAMELHRYISNTNIIK